MSINKLCSSNTLANPTVFYMTLGGGVRKWKSRLWLIPYSFIHLHSIITGEIYLLHSYYIILCALVVVVQNFRIKTKPPKHEHKIKWSWRFSVAEARTHGLWGCLKTISFEYQKEYHISVMVMLLLTVFGFFFSPQTLEWMQRLYTFFCECAHQITLGRCWFLGCVYYVNFNSTEKKIFTEKFVQHFMLALCAILPTPSPDCTAHYILHVN